MLAAGAERAAAETLLVELSTDLIAIASNFAGAELSLFGVVQRDVQTVSRAGAYHVVVVVAGPTEDVLVQRRARRFGIWVNTDGERFTSLPSYYGVFATDGAGALVDAVSLTARAPAAPPNEEGAEQRAAFLDAIVRQRRARGLFVVEDSGVIKMTPTVFRTRIPLPPLVEDGEYNVTAHLFADGVRLDTLSTRFFVSKVGYEERLFQLSRERPLIYGLVAVALALTTGYVGGVIFRRN